MSSRRASSSRTASTVRPRTKGWRDVASSDEASEERVDPVRSTNAVARRPQAAVRQRAIAQVGRMLTPQQTESVRAVMRLFLQEDLARGVPRDRQLRCPCCGATKWAAGFVLYGRSTFCNDCAAELELSRLRGRCESASEFLAWRADQAAG